MTSPHITTVVVDYGGVLTNPLDETFATFAHTVGVPLAALRAAFAAAARRHGRSPMADLETGLCTEEEMVARVLAELPGEPSPHRLLGKRSFGELWFRGRTPNEPMLQYLRATRRRGYRIALLTNNVAEWRHRWRAQLPVDELFSVVVDSSEEGVRKPDKLLYTRLLERLGTSPAACVFLDDTEENCVAASDLGMLAIRFTTTDEAIDQVEAVLRSRGVCHPRSW